MTLSLQNAEVFDIEVLPNCFTFAMECLHSDTKAVWEISEFRDDRASLLEHFRYLNQTQTPLIGFNSIGYDYPIIHMLWQNPNITYQQLHQKSQAIITGNDRWGHQVWPSDRFCPQIDLFKLQHFDNKAKSTSLKALQINMRAENVVESSLPFDRPLTQQEIDGDLIPYNQHDVKETKRFALYSMNAIEFRIGLVQQFGLDVLNWNDTKIGEQMMISLLGDELCYDRSSGKRRTRQSPRSEIPLKDVIFPYIRFEHPEFNRILDYLRSQTLRTEELNTDEEGLPTLKTKGVFKDLSATVNGFQFDYGIGGIHGSVKKKIVISNGNRSTRDIDVKGLYPNLAIVNGMYPEHLGQKFVNVYAKIPQEREHYQKTKGKKCTEANTLKLAANGGTYGKSNSVFSPMFDPRYMVQTTVNGQLLLSMLSEWLMKIPTIQFVQINTDGITYQIDQEYLPEAKAVEKQWENFTLLVLEDVDYSRVWVRDVNNYIAEAVDGTLKLKGAYFTPDPLNYHQSIADAGVWHKKFDAVVSTRAAVAHMVDGVDIETYIRMCTNPYDFCCAVKINRSDKLLWGDIEQQRNTRFFVATEGEGLVKISPPAGEPGAFKKANGVTDAEYARVMAETGGQWDGRVCTKNQSRYEQRSSAIMAGYKVQVVNDISKFDFSKINYDWYLQEALKLII